MNGIKIYVAKDPTNNLIVLDGIALDLFDDESIVITMKQTDIKDLAVNYTDFSQTFTIPPSPTNNKALRYWYDVSNLNQLENSNGIPARIDIGGVYFRKGVIKVNSANYNDDGQLKSYTIQFTAGLKALKDLFGDKKLSDLKFEDTIGNNIPFLDTDVYNSLNNTNGSNAIEIPLISSTRYLPAFSKMKYISDPTRNPDGIKRIELRPAIKFDAILYTIANDYGLNFRGGFFNTSPSIAGIENLYLWLNKNDNVFNSGGTPVILGVFPANNVKVMTPGPQLNYFTIELQYCPPPVLPNIMPDFMYIRFDTLSISNNTVEYITKIQEVILNANGTVDEATTNTQPNYGIVAQSKEFIKGAKTNSVEWNWDLKNTSLLPGAKRHFRIIAEAKDGGYTDIITSKIRVSQLKKLIFFGTPIISEVSAVECNNFGSTQVFNKVTVKDNIPELSIYDFLASMIKMFNIVVIPKLNNEFQFEYYRDFYNAPDVKTFDITEFVFPNRKINKIKTYKNLAFKYEDSEYGSNITFKKRQSPSREYGSISQAYDGGDGGDYKVESKFSLMLFRELAEIDFAEKYEMNQTWIVGDGVGESDGDIVNNKPTIFYYNGKSDIKESKFLCYTLDVGTSMKIERYSQFSNLDNILNYKNSLCFSSEYVIDGTLRDKNLYSLGYGEQIAKTYSIYAREQEIECYLPKWIVTTIKLNDTIKIDNQTFQINEIEINLTTGKAKMKLLNNI